MTAVEAIKMKQDNENRARIAREKTWQKIAAMEFSNPELHSELKKAFRRPKNKG